MRIARPSTRALVLAPVALAAIAIPSAAMAAGGASHVFNSCIDQDGFVWATVMDADPGCAGWQAYLNTDTGDGLPATPYVLTAVSFNQQGANGAPGAAGVAGAKGANGVSGYTTVTKSVSVAKHKASTLSLSCPTGKKVTGGGAQPSADSVELLASYPSAGGAGWTARVSNTAGSNKSVKLYAICATA
jgi:hypothetical protein